MVEIIINKILYSVLLITLIYKVPVYTIAKTSLEDV